jgi:hypothetical protein
MIASSYCSYLNREQVRAGCTDGLKRALLKIFMTNVYGHDSNWRQVVCCLFIDE